MGSQDTPQELQTFLLDNKSKMKDAPQNKTKSSQVQEKSEAIHLNGGLDFYDPFLERNLEHPTTDCETLTHLLKASLGTGILAMPQAFMFSGLIMGVFGTIFVSVVCTYCSYVLGWRGATKSGAYWLPPKIYELPLILIVKCAHVLYRRAKVTSMSYADVAEVAFANGPLWCRKFSSLTREAILWLLFITYFGTCCVYTVIIANNFSQIFNEVFELQLGLQYYIAALLVPLILLSYVPNLKYLAPVSMVANILMACGLGITFYYLLREVPTVTDKKYVGNLENFPTFFCTTVFAMEAIGVVMPLENNMKTPKHFLGLFGVLNVGMGGVTIIYILLGFLGYAKYGIHTSDNIPLNLPVDEIPAQASKIFIGLAVFCTYGLQFFVCLEIAWAKVQTVFKKTTNFHNYLLRTIMVVLSILIAVLVPQIGPFISLIGAFCFSLLGIMAPVVIEFATYWNKVTPWMIIRNVVLLIIGFMALVFGTVNSVSEIITKLTNSTSTSSQ